MLNAKQIFGLDELAGAIIARAVRDYEMAYKSYRKRGGDPSRLKELRKFFCSEWFSVLSEVDGNYLMHTIERSVEARTKQRRTKKCLHSR